MDFTSMQRSFVSILPIALLVGRIIAGGYFLYGAYNHFTNLKMIAGYAKTKGTPAAEIAVGGTGLLLLLGGASLLLGFHPTIGAILLIVFLVGVSFNSHKFWAISDPMAKMAERVNFTKNMALLGFLLMTLAIPRPWPFSIGG
jgi:putative oxidoreductase